MAPSAASTTMARRTEPAAASPANAGASPSQTTGSASEITTAQGLADAYRRLGHFDSLRKQLLKDFQASDEMKRSFENRLDGIVRDKLAFDARRRNVGRDSRDRYGRSIPHGSPPAPVGGIASKEQHGDMLRELERCGVTRCSWSWNIDPSSRHSLYERTITAMQDRLLDLPSVEDALLDILDASRPPEKRRKVATPPPSQSAAVNGSPLPAASGESGPGEGTDELLVSTNDPAAARTSEAADGDTSMADVSALPESEEPALLQPEELLTEVADNPSALREASPGPPPAPSISAVAAAEDQQAEDAALDPVVGVDLLAPKEDVVDASSSATSATSADPSPATTTSLLPGIEMPPPSEAKPARRKSVRRSTADSAAPAMTKSESGGATQTERRKTRSSLSGSAEEPAKGRVTRSGSNR